MKTRLFCKFKIEKNIFIHNVPYYIQYNTFSKIFGADVITNLTFSHIQTLRERNYANWCIFKILT